MNVVDPSRPEYHSYLLRLWQDAPQTVWHASLQSTATEQISHFPTVEALVGFLDARFVTGGDDATSKGRGLADTDERVP